jgi:hypothetical protein
VQLLNDLFGVQARGGCLCAGPYGQQLLGISPDQSRVLQHQLVIELEELVRTTHGRRRGRPAVNMRCVRGACSSDRDSRVSAFRTT